MRVVHAVAGRYGVLVGNVAARIAALVSLALATLLVARTGGAAAVGVYALLRVLPGLVGVLAAAGLPSAVPYFLAGPRRVDRRLPTTIVALAVAGGAAGTALWAAGAPVLGTHLFPDMSLALVTLASLLVLTQVSVITAKSCSQGSADMPGANRVIVTEQLMFLPAYGLLWAGGLRGYAIVVVAALLADVATASLAWTRLVRRGFFRGVGRPSARLARALAGYGLRAQVGGVVVMLNLRLDFVILGVLAGPAVLGVYAIASKFAELIRVVTMAVTYVLYPRYASEGKERAASAARALMPRALLLSASGALPLLVAAGLVIPAIYGPAFEAAVTPARIILLALAFEGVAAVVTAFLYGAGRPGLNSLAMAAGLVVTVVLDLLLIPRYGANGAAVASAAAYMMSTAALVFIFRRLRRTPAQGPKVWDEPTLAGGGQRR